MHRELTKTFKNTHGNQFKFKTKSFFVSFGIVTTRPVMTSFFLAISSKWLHKQRKIKQRCKSPMSFAVAAAE